MKSPKIIHVIISHLNIIYQKIIYQKLNWKSLFKKFRFECYSKESSCGHENKGETEAARQRENENPLQEKKHLTQLVDGVEVVVIEQAMS